MVPGVLEVAAKIFSLRTTAEAVVGLSVLAAGVTGTATVDALPAPVRSAVAEAAASLLPAVLPHDDHQNSPSPAAVAGDPAPPSVRSTPLPATDAPSSGARVHQAAGPRATDQQAPDAGPARQQESDHQPTDQQGTDPQESDQQSTQPEQALAAPVADPAPAEAAGDGSSDASGSSVSSLVTGAAAGSVSVALLDTATGNQEAYGATSGMRSGSIAKLLILEAWLLREQDGGESPGGDQSATLAAMIEHSDNDAADSLYEGLGGADGAAEAIARLGLTATAPGPDGEWGLTSTNSADQLSLLQNLVSPGGPLSAASRAYALSLMRNVEADQRWGVGAAADPGTSFANKNGWLNVEGDGGRWLVNSLGVITVNGHQVLMAVLTQHDVDFATGVQLVESLATAAASDLR